MRGLHFALLVTFFTSLLADGFKRRNYFDVYSPIQTRYSEVFWTKSSAIPLPEHIVSRFHGKVMSITGYEVDQVTRTAEGDKSFPLHHAYNHHYSAWLLSKDSKMVRSDKLPTPNSLTTWFVEDKPAEHGFPTSITIEKGQVSEFKKFHRFPVPQLIHSPSSFSVEPLQIDIHNREFTGPGYKPWFLPKSANTSNSESFSPLIGCPCTDRVTKRTSSASTLEHGTCQKPIASAQDCFTQAKSVAQVTRSVTVHDMKLPAGCLISRAEKSTKFTAVFNSAPSAQACGAPGPIIRGRTTSLVDLTLQIDPTSNVVSIIMAGQNGVWFGVGFNAQVMADAPYTIVVDGAGVVTEHKLANHDPGVQLNSTISVVSNTVTGTTRTVAMTRSVAGKNSDYYTFPTTPTTINFIDAYGNTPDFEYHQDRTDDTIVLSASASDASASASASASDSACVCAPTTYLSYMNKPMIPYNFVEESLQCCQHGWFLTDRDQENLIPESVDKYFMKFRFFYEEYN